MKQRPTHTPSLYERWAHLRFQVIGHLLAAPPRRGELGAELDRLADKKWRHPVTGQLATFGRSTIEHWYYVAKNAPQDPVARLRKKARKDLGRFATVALALRQLLHEQYVEHRSWSYRLHYDNAVARAESDRDVGAVPSYATVRRYMRAVGLLRRAKIGGEPTDGTRRAARRLDEREVRSYEHAYVSGLWHTDFHHGRKKVLTEGGTYATPIALCFVDDHSRLVCHLQWYFAENAENLVHGLMQALQKRGLPRSLMTDNGKALTADEVVQGLARLGILHETTLPYSPYQNAKQERLWGHLEGRLISQLENVPDLTLARLNEVTQAWVEGEYNRREHSELGTTPLARFLDGKDVSRPCPTTEVLRQAFCADERRTQRRSDGTISVDGQRFELSSRYRHLDQVTIRRASWDLRWVYLVDERTGAVLCRIYPQDKTANADGQRRALEPLDPTVTLPATTPPSPALPPLLARLVDAQAQRGLPPAYIPKDERASAPAAALLTSATTDDVATDGGAL